MAFKFVASVLFQTPKSNGEPNMKKSGGGCSFSVSNSNGVK
nr:MAG TPA: hypothetical protein [Caudoviricetes sp.]